MIRRNTSFVIASPSCAFLVWSWRMRFPTPMSGRILAFRFAPAKLAFNQRRMQLWPEGFERNHRRNRCQRIVLFGETFIATAQIEKAKLSHPNLSRSVLRAGLLPLRHFAGL